MLGIVIICGASYYIETCTVRDATIVFQAPQVFEDAETCTIETYAFAEITRLAKPGDVTRIICAYPPERVTVEERK